MKRDLIRCLPFVLFALLTLASTPALSRPPDAPQPELTCPPCDDLNACTTDTCDPSTGTCRYEAVNCNDGNDCTFDSCHPIAFGSPCGAGCCHQPLINLPCDDGNSCTGAGTCQNGACVATELPGGTACDDGDPCTDLDTCNATGSCAGSALPTGTPCNDST